MQAKHWWSIALTPLVLFLACWRMAGPIIDSPGRSEGTVIGAYDRRPIPGVLVVGIWTMKDSPDIHGSTGRPRFVSTTVSDQVGKYVLKGPGLSLRPLFKSYSQAPQLLAWKPNYEQLDASRGQVVMWPLPASVAGTFTSSDERLLARELMSWIATSSRFPEDSFGRPLLDRFPTVGTAIENYARSVYPEFRSGLAARTKS